MVLAQFAQHRGIIRKACGDDMHHGFVMLHQSVDHHQPRAHHDAALRRAGEAAFEGARPLSGNAFKVELGIRVVGEALRIAGQRA